MTKHTTTISKSPRNGNYKQRKQVKKGRLPIKDNSAFATNVRVHP
jgi:hypothetical protein